MIRPLRIFWYFLNRFGNRIYFCFPVQLFLSQVRNHKILLLFWAILFGIVTYNFGFKLGGAYLFLDPEYLGKVNGLSMLLFGLAIGIFITAYHITAYILDGFHYHFLIFLKNPFFRFSLNNSMVPFLFLVIYSWYFFDFQIQSAMLEPFEIVLYLFAFYFGAFLSIFIFGLYFFNTEKNFFTNFRQKFGKQFRFKNKYVDNVKRKILEKRARDEMGLGLVQRVDYFLSDFFKVRKVRYNFNIDYVLIKDTIDRNQINAGLVVLLTLVIFISLGLFKEVNFIQIPASASLILLFSIFMMLAGAINFFLQKSGGAWLFLLLLFLFYANRQDWYVKTNKAFGINYESKPADYSRNKIQELASDENFNADKKNGTNVLENWVKRFNPTDTNSYSSLSQPKIIFINTSGGGLRSAVWTLNTLITLDSVFNGEISKHTFLICGASGGMIGAACYRELMLGNPKPWLNGQSTIDKLSSDLLNRIFFNITTTMIVPPRSFKEGNNSYPMDRGYAFESQLIQNTGLFKNKKLKDYSKLEQSAFIPWVIMTPTSANDGRKLYISSLPVSFLVKSFQFNEEYKNEISGVEFSRMFANQNPENLYFTTALRMNATFPYILPNVRMNSTPVLEVIDAGATDNYGTETSLKFLYVFRDWIKDHTSGVIFLQIRDSKQQKEIEKSAAMTVLEKITNPIGGYYHSITSAKDFKDDEALEFAHTWFGGKLEIVQFQYIPETEALTASLSWHLTRREKKNIIESIHHPENQNAIRLLGKLLNSSE
ncbi:MAG: hypothetical protein A3G23_08325 [Bacteroidetes bacterium RIFCSPLOWO2_12_FULL_37_12]|nr:MAG: hypothetical protein A3G23_08325 [Bacteroidetes bacterium RIFCSPLOWO2_12_FULL_37_12]